MSMKFTPIVLTLLFCFGISGNRSAVRLFLSARDGNAVVALLQAIEGKYFFSLPYAGQKKEQGQSGKQDEGKDETAKNEKEQIDTDNFHSARGKISAVVIEPIFYGTN